MLVVPGQRADRTEDRLTGVGTEAASSSPPGVRRLRPGVAAVAGEVDARNAHPGREWAPRRIAGVARLHVDVVVGAADQHRRLDRVNGETRLVLLVLRKRRGGT